MKLELVPIDSLKSAEKNPRMHPRKQLDEIYKNFLLFGQIKNIVIGRDNSIIAGNGLWTALKEHDIKEIWVERRNDLDELDAKKLMIADNRLYEIGATNNDVLQELFYELKEQGELDIPGYDKELLDDLYLKKSELDDKLADYGKPDQDKIEEMKIHQLRLDGRGEQGEIVLTNKRIQTEIDEDGQIRAFIICSKCGEKICL